MNPTLLATILVVVGLIDAAIGIFMLNRAPDPTRPAAPNQANFATVGRLMFVSAGMIWLVAILIAFGIIPVGEG